MLDYIVIRIIKLLIITFKIIVKPFSKQNNTLNCVIMGYCGLNNTGAECRINEMIKQINNELPNRLTIKIFTHNEKLTSRYIEESPNISIIECAPHQLFKVSKIIAQCDIFILAEGCTFKDDLTPLLIWAFFFTCGLAQSLGKTTIAYAVDAGKMSKPHQKFAKTIANNLDLLTVRTKKSVALLEEIGVTNTIKITADTAFLTDVKDLKWFDKLLTKNKINKNKPLIGIAYKDFYCWPIKPDFLKLITNNKTDHYKSCCYFTSSKTDKNKSKILQQLLASYADWCAEEFDANIAIIAMEEMDNKPCEDLMKEMKHKPIFINSSHYNAEEIATILTNLHFLISTRYHAIILSMQKAIPFIGLSFDERIEEIMKELNLNHDYYINYDEPNLLEKLKNNTLKIESNHASISKTIKEAFPNYINRMNSNTQLFKELINQ